MTRLARPLFALLAVLWTAGLLLLAAFVLLMLVMRSLLAAIAQHDELEVVI